MSKIAKTPITFVPHTHWDREWYLPFEVFRTQLVAILDEALGLLERETRLHFTLDGQMALVEDYLELRPEAEPRVRALVQAGRLHVGPWFTASDTLLVDGEAVIRNLAMGVRMAEALGGVMRVGYMPDQFGHAAQVPQVLRLFGIEQAVLWRGVGPERPPHTFRWVAPDGSAVRTAWLQDGYGTGRRIPSEPSAFVGAVERTLERVGAQEPLLLPIGDDHVRLAAWLPAAVDELARRHPELAPSVGPLGEHFERAGEPTHEVRGELRSPVFAPVLAGVAAVRIREKQAAARTTVTILRYAEPLAAWLAALGQPAPRQLLARAWRHLLHNHAHDSAAGCGADEAHDDVKSRYRWAEQLALAARDHALATIAVEAPPNALAQVNAFHPGPAAAQLAVEAELPRALFDAARGPLVAAGSDGIARPVQVLGDAEQPPLFEGEFSAAELGVYLGGLDPATPLFGRYLSGITVTDDGPGRVRLDVGLGDAPVPHGKLDADQERVKAMIGKTERFRVVLHGAGLTRRVVLAGGPAPASSVVALAVRSGAPEPGLPRAGRWDDGSGAVGHVGMFAGSIRVVAEPDGRVRITDAARPEEVIRANDLVDEGDRGDLYHCDPVSPAVRASTARAILVEEGPLRARMRIEQDVELPVTLAADRTTRSSRTRHATLATEITVTAGERRIEFVTRFDNEVRDHRLRALVHLPFRAERLDADGGLAVVPRPLDPSALGAGNERPAPTGQHHLFVDASDGTRGAALLSRGLPEHEAIRDGDSTTLALTLVRAVGWLARGDLSCIDHAVGPMLETPAAQEPGTHRFEYALVLHDGDWEQGGVLAEAQRFAAPPIVFAATGATKVPVARALVECDAPAVRVLASYAGESGGIVVRLLNAGARPVETSLAAAFPIREALATDPLERPLPPASAEARAVSTVAGRPRIALRPWQLATVILRFNA